MIVPTRRIAAIGFLVIALAACGGGETADDTTRTDTSRPTIGAAPMDSAAGAPIRSPARDADHEFLRSMSDHHQGLIAMASAAMTKASVPETQSTAHTLHVKQEAGQKEMVEMVQREYDESLTPTIMPAHQAMSDSLQAMTGPAYDRTFYRNVVAHHREGIAMVDRFMPRLTKPAVRQMAERMKSEQQAEITELERKRQTLPAG